MIKLFKNLSEDERNEVRNSGAYKCMLGDYNYIESYIAYNKEYFGLKHEDYSVIVFEGKNPVIILYMICECSTIMFFNNPIKIFCDKNSSSEVLNTAYRELLLHMRKQIDGNNEIKSFSFYYDEYLVAEYFNSIASVQVEHNSYVDLSLPAETIRMNIRKSYKSLVNWGEKSLDVVIVDYNNPLLESFNAFKNFHIETAGKQTRSDKTWELQWDAIVKKEAYLVNCYLDKKLVACSYILYGPGIAYYGVGVYDRMLMSENKPISHYCIFYSIIHAKSLGLKKFVLGSADRTSEDEKVNNINTFKKGFSSTIDIKVTYTINIKEHE